MCGRFSQAYTWAEIHAFSQPLTVRSSGINLRPHYNIAPTTQVQMLVTSDGELELVAARWGLVPRWWKKSLRETGSTFNARIETASTSPMFRDAFKRRRCIIPASGFYEWTGEKKERVPHYFSATSGGLIGIAGLWDSWRTPEGDEMRSCAMLVGEPDEWMRRFHDRMPAMLRADDLAPWLDGTAGQADLVDQMARPPALQEWVVSSAVNKAGAGDDDPSTIARVEPAS